MTDALGNKGCVADDPLDQNTTKTGLRQRLWFFTVS